MDMAKNFLRRLQPLTLCALLFLAGCGRSPAASETPSPAASDPSHTPPVNVFLQLDTGPFTITNSDGETLTCTEGEFSGSMEILEKYDTPDIVESLPPRAAAVPYSARLTYERTEPPAAGESWIFSAADLSGGFLRQLFIAQGGGNVTQVDYDDSGVLRFQGEAGVWVLLQLAMPDSALGFASFVWLNVLTGEEDILLQASGNKFSFSGLTTEISNLSIGATGTDGEPIYVNCILSYGGENDFSGIVPLDLEKSSGTLDFSGIADGSILLTEQSCDTRNILAD